MALNYEGARAMRYSRRIAHFATIGGLGIAMPSGADTAAEACSKNHYILDEPCTVEWTAVNGGLRDLDVHVVAVDPVKQSTLYAGGPSGLFKSEDGGASWSATGLVMETETAANYPFFNLPGPFTMASIVAHLAIDPANPGTVYAGTVRGNACIYSQRRVFKSSDGGARWTDLLSPHINGCDNIHSLVLAPGNPPTLYLTNFDDATGDTWSPLVRSTDGAASWTYLGYPVLNVLAVDPHDSRVVYAGTFDFDPYFTTLPNGVLKSSDGGATWAATALTGSGVNALAGDPSEPHTLYAATVKGLFKSVDGGEKWEAIGDGLDDVVGTKSSIVAVIVEA